MRVQLCGFTKPDIPSSTFCFSGTVPTQRAMRLKRGLFIFLGFCFCGAWPEHLTRATHNFHFTFLTLRSSDWEELDPFRYGNVPIFVTPGQLMINYTQPSRCFLISVDSYLFREAGRLKHQHIISGTKGTAVRGSHVHNVQHTPPPPPPLCLCLSGLHISLPVTSLSYFQLVFHSHITSVKKRLTPFLLALCTSLYIWLFLGFFPPLNWVTDGLNTPL